MKQLSKHIPFRPMPYHGELFKGYIIRLASRNGRDELKDFVSAFDIGMNCQSIFIAGSERYYEFLCVLAPSMDIDKKVLEAFFDGEKSVQMMDWLSVRRTVVRRPSLCPSCVAKKGYLKAEWHLYYATHCREHECKLWTACPRCAKEFAWQGRLLQGCTSCYLQWKDVSPVKARLPASQKAIAKAQGKKKEVLIEAILQNLKVSLRPYDASILQPRDLDLYVDDMTSHIEHAYQLATSHEAIDELKLARQEHWQSKVGDGNFALIKQLETANEPIFDKLKSQSNQKFDKMTEVKEASHMILSSHRRLNTKPDKASLELSWQQLKSVLKIDKP
jgi:hypothetical protein